MDPHQENTDDAEAWDIGDVLPEIFSEDAQYPGYDDDVEPSTQTAIPDIARWTPPFPLQTPTVSDRAKSSQEFTGPGGTTPNLDPTESIPIDFGIEHATPDEASRPQEVMQKNYPEDEIFSLINFDPDPNFVDPVEHQVSPFNAPLDDTLGLSGPDANLSTTPFVGFDLLAPSTPLETAGYPQTANATTWDFTPEDGCNSILNMAPPAADLDHVHNPAWMPFLPDSGTSFKATMSVTPTGILNPDPAEGTSHTSSVLLPPTQIVPIALNHQRHPLSQTPHCTYAPILPRQSPSTNSTLAGKRQGPSSPSDASFKIAVVPHAQASAMRGQKQGNDVPASYLCEFDSSKSVGFGGDERQLSNPQKRTRRDTDKVGRSCLRCK